MQVNRLKLSSFRNYDVADIELGEGQNLIFGENAQGKTNLLEALFYLSCLKTFRAGRDADMIKHGESVARLEGIFDAYGREIQVVCDITKTGRRLFVNGIPQKKPRDHIGLIKTVLFSPDDLLLVKEGPAGRRRFMNIALSQLRPSYIKALSEHNKLIESKRKILKMEQGREAFYDYFDVLNEKLAHAAAYITYERAMFLKKAEGFASEAMHDISRGSEELSLKYNFDSAIEDPLSEENFKRIYDHLNRRRDAELASGMCLVGAHRDDFTVCINGDAARDFGSQGQIRSSVLALKIAEKKIIESDSGEAPILLLDDVLSELDPNRRDYLVNGISGGQTVITGCDRMVLSELRNGRMFTIESGAVAASHCV